MKTLHAHRMKALYAARPSPGPRVQTPESSPTGSQTRPVPKLDLEKLRAAFRRMIQNRNSE